jgi:hypothetical protein
VSVALVREGYREQLRGRVARRRSGELLERRPWRRTATRSEARRGRGRGGTRGSPPCTSRRTRPAGPFREGVVSVRSWASASEGFGQLGRPSRPMPGRSPAAWRGVMPSRASPPGRRPWKRRGSRPGTGSADCRSPSPRPRGTRAGGGGRICAATASGQQVMGREWRSAGLCLVVRDVARGRKERCRVPPASAASSPRRNTSSWGTSTGPRPARAHQPAFQAAVVPRAGPQRKRGRRTFRTKA